MTPYQKTVFNAVIDDLKPLIHKAHIQRDLSVYVPYLCEYLGQPIMQAVIIDGPFNGKYNQLAAIPRGAVKLGSCETTKTIAVAYKDFARFVATGTRKPPASSTQRIVEACRESVIGTKIYKKFPPRSGYNVDHCGDYEFNDIVDKFVEQCLQNYNLSLEDISEQTQKQSNGIRQFADKHLKKRFVDLHEQLAELQYLTVAEHKEKTRLSKLKARGMNI